MTTSTQKILVNCQDGLNNIERATIAFILAVTASKTHETAMFLNAEATKLCVKGTVQSIEAPGYEPLANLVDAYLKNGGKIWLCPACVHLNVVLCLFRSRSFHERPPLGSCRMFVSFTCNLLISHLYFSYLQFELSNTVRFFA